MSPTHTAIEGLRRGLAGAVFTPDRDRVVVGAGPSNYDRLNRVKAEHDSDYVLHLNHSITPVR